MSPLRRTQRFGIALWAACLLVTLSAAMDGRDKPNIDTRNTGTSCVFEQRMFEEIPSGRSYQNLINVEPRVRVTPQGDPKKPGSVRVDGVGAQSWDLPRSRFDRRNCGGTFKKNDIRLESGLRFNMSCEWLHEPNERAYLRFSNLKLGQERFSDWVIAYKPSLTDTRSEPPPDPGTPGIPVPNPGAPDVPAPAEPRFEISNWGWVMTGLTGRYRVSALPHDNHDAHSVIVGGVPKFLCTEGEGEGAAKVDQINPDSVQLRKTSPPRAGWEWSPIVFTNAADGIRGAATGTFYGKPVQATFWGLEARRGDPNFSMNHSVKLLETQSEVPFRLEGRVDQILRY